MPQARYDVILAELEELGATLVPDPFAGGKGFVNASDGYGLGFTGAAFDFQVRYTLRYVAVMVTRIACHTHACVLARS